MSYLEFLSRNEAPMRAVDPRWDVMSSAFGFRLAGKTPRDPEATRIAWGMRHGVDVEIEQRPRGRGTSVAISIPVQVGATLGVSVEPALRGIAAVTSSGQWVGGSDFGRHYRVDGDRENAREVLTESVRQRFLRLRGDGQLRLRDGRLEFVIGRDLGSLERLDHDLRRLVDLAKALGVPREQQIFRLRRALNNSPQRAVRLEAFEALRTGAYGPFEVEEGFKNSSDEVKLVAARLLGLDASRDMLVRIIEGDDEELSSQAMTWYTRESARAFSEVDEAAFIRFLSARHPSVVDGAAQALGQHGTIQAVEALAAVRDGENSSTEAVRTARTAILQIQERLEGAGAGHVSLADDEVGGAVSVAADSGGLSYPKKGNHA